MKTYLITVCNKDGSTPLGMCPEYEILAEDYYNLLSVLEEKFPECELVSWGLKEDIERCRITF